MVENTLLQRGDKDLGQCDRKQSGKTVRSEAVLEL